MSKNTAQQPDLCQPMVYQIRVEGHLGSEWAGCFDGFEGLNLTLQANGDSLLTGTVVDQSALFGLLKQVRDFGMTLVSVNRVKHNQADALERNPGASATSKKRRRRNERAKHAGWCSGSRGKIYCPRGRNHG